MFFESLNDFRKLCPDQPAECATACCIFMDLILDKKYASVEKCYDKNLKVLYLRATTLDKSEIKVLPSLVTQQLDLNIINELQSNGCNLILAICDTSSNILYYRCKQNWS